MKENCPPVDDWLWIPYKNFYYRQRNFIERRTKGDRYRKRVKEATRQYRERLKEEPRNKLIRRIYWHEVNRPTVPIRQYK